MCTCKNRCLATGASAAARVLHKKISPSHPPLGSTCAVHGGLLDASMNGFQALNVIGTGAKLASSPGPLGGGAWGQG